MVVCSGNQGVNGITFCARQRQVFLESRARNQIPFLSRLREFAE